MSGGFNFGDKVVVKDWVEDPGTSVSMAGWAGMVLFDGVLNSTGHPSVYLVWDDETVKSQPDRYGAYANDSHIKERFCCVNCGWLDRRGTHWWKWV